MLNYSPALLEEFIVKTVWTKRLIVGEILDHIINLFNRERVFQKFKRVSHLHKKFWIGKEALKLTSAQSDFEVLPDSLLLLLVISNSHATIHNQFLNQIPPMPDGGISMKEASSSIPQLSPFD